MAAKQIRYEQDVRERMLAGLNKLANTVHKHEKALIRVMKPKTKKHVTAILMAIERTFNGIDCSLLLTNDDL